MIAVIADCSRLAPHATMSERFCLMYSFAAPTTPAPALVAMQTTDVAGAVVPPVARGDEDRGAKAPRPLLGGAPSGGL